jgi:hypothetical protein
VTALLCCLALVVTAARASESEPAARAARESSRRSFAILGEVAHPGVFELSLPQVQLLDLVTLAGGTTPGASGNVRIVRGGRPGWQTWLTPGTTFSLRPNDLVIVDAAQSLIDRRSSSHLSNAPAAGGAGSRPASELVHLGIVQLISRPVVLDLSRDQASVKSVLSLLHQPLRDNGKLTVVKPFGGMEVFERDQPQDVPLAAGAVLIFDPGNVNAAVLPQLPATIALEPIGTTLAASPASVPEPVSEAPVNEPVFPNGPAESGERPEFVPRKLPASHSTAARRNSRSPRPSLAGPAAQNRSPRLNGLLALAGVLSSAILAAWLRRTAVFERVTKSVAGRALKVKLRLAKTSEPLAAGTGQSLPQESDTSEYRLQQPNYRIDAAHQLSGAISESESPSRRPPPAENEARSHPLPLQTGRQIRIDGGHLPVSPGTLDRALAALDKK